MGRRKKEKKLKHCILVNNLFVGEYGRDIRNLPHEVINFYRTDADETGKSKLIVYIAPLGNVSEEYVYDGILFIRSAENKMVEILGKAEGEIKYLAENIKIVGRGKNKHVDLGTISESYKQKLDSIMYGGCSLREIHSANKSDIGILASFEVERILLPQRPIYLPTSLDFKKNVNIINGCLSKPINNQSMKAYIEKTDEDNSDYDFLMRYIFNADIWGSAEEIKSFDECDDVFDDNILKIIGKQNSENVFSNFICYFISKYPSVLKYFIEDVLGVMNLDLNAVEVLREKDRLDIRIQKEAEFIIVIENKIKSGINGVKEIDTESTDDIESQLSKYKTVAKEYLGDSNGVSKFFIMHPNYNKLDVSKYRDGTDYYPITYKNIYDKFSLFDISCFTERDAIYWDELLKATYKHTTENDNEFRDDMLKRLKHRIDLIKSKKKF